MMQVSKSSFSEITAEDHNILSSAVNTKPEDNSIINLNIYSNIGIVILLNIENKIIACNQMLYEITGAGPNDIAGLTIRKLCKILNVRSEKLIFVKGNCGNPSSQPRRITMHSLNGEVKHLILHYSAIKDLYGNKKGYIIFGSDISAFEKEQENIQHQERLAMIGQLGSGIVHETKNMIAAIKGYCQLISLKSENDYIKCTVKKIENITSELTKMITEFLVLAKPASQNFKFVSLNNIIHSIKFMLESPSFINGVNIKYNLTKSEKYIYADELQIKQVILNMAKNAIEAMADIESPLLVISTSLSESTNTMVLTISDNGKGLTQEDIKNLGMPFYTTKDYGTGLGLSNCYRIIKQHNGKISVKSEIGKGTTFTIHIPCK